MTTKTTMHLGYDKGNPAGRGDSKLPPRSRGTAMSISPSSVTIVFEL